MTKITLGEVRALEGRLAGAAPEKVVGFVVEALRAVAGAAPDVLHEHAAESLAALLRLVGQCSKVLDAHDDLVSIGTVSNTDGLRCTAMMIEFLIDPKVSPKDIVSRMVNYIVDTCQSDDDTNDYDQNPAGLDEVVMMMSWGDMMDFVFAASRSLDEDLITAMWRTVSGDGGMGALPDHVVGIIENYAARRQERLDQGGQVEVRRDWVLVTYAQPSTPQSAAASASEDHDE